MPNPPISLASTSSALSDSKKTGMMKFLLVFAALFSLATAVPMAFPDPAAIPNPRPKPFPDPMAQSTLSTDKCNEGRYDSFVDDMVECLRDADSLVDQALFNNEPVSKGLCDRITAVVSR